MFIFYLFHRLQRSNSGCSSSCKGFCRCMTSMRAIATVAVERHSEWVNMSKQQPYTGGCLCGAVRFEANRPASRPHACSCKMCQRHSGAVTTLWVEFPKEAVTWTGPDGAPATYRSSKKSSRAFCATCGSTVGAIDDAPVVALLLGGFDNLDDRQLMPASHSCRHGLPNWWQNDTGND